MNWEIILSELNANTDTQISTELLTLIKQTDRIFLTGAGRSGLALRAFTMRLSQLGKVVFFVGETTTPAIGESDLLIIASSSGETSQLIKYAGIAKDAGAKIWLWSTNDTNPLANKADYVTLLAGKSKFTSAEAVTVQPMGSLFEQSVWLFGDLFTLNYMREYDISEENLKERHANLE
ncbi:6-phospho-3-hexuloisomerase [Weissella soli]|uniref:6-phospho-3-hexuloisomerase n=1 Tax=Weissella soli TaxID=155866 RepID=UPI00359F1556